MCDQPAPRELRDELWETIDPSCRTNDLPDPRRDYREWSEMKAEGIEIETMQEYVDEVRGFNDHPPEDVWPEDNPNYFRDEEEPMYEIVRFHRDSEHPDHRRVMESGLTLEEAQEHCNSPDTREEDELGTVWFDGYSEEGNYRS